MDFGKHWFQDKHMTCTTNSSVVILIVTSTSYFHPVHLCTWCSQCKAMDQVLLDVVFVFLL